MEISTQDYIQTHTGGLAMAKDLDSDLMAIFIQNLEKNDIDQQYFFIRLHHFLFWGSLDISQQ